MINKKFNRLKVIEFSHYDKRHRKHYLCQCDCGTLKTIQGSLLKSGNTKNCGCLSMEIKKSKRLPNNRGVINHLILQYKRHAKNRNIKFKLTYDEFNQIIKQNCHYCGLKPSNNKITKNCNGFLYSGIDRIDSNKPYVMNNCVACCDKCNKAKRNYSKEEFIEWIKRVYSYQNAMAEQWNFC